MKGVVVDTLLRVITAKKPWQAEAMFQPFATKDALNTLMELRTAVVAEQMSLIHSGTSITDVADQLERLEEGRILIEFMVKMSRYRSDADEARNSPPTINNPMTP